MKIDLPALAEQYIRLANAHDADGVARCFSKQAEVHDEGGVHQGTAAIREWSRASSEKYAPKIVIAGYQPTALGGIVTGDVHGNFPGSPLRLQFAFKLGANAIDALEISA